MINQYTSSYGSISTDIQNIIANKISLTNIADFFIDRPKSEAIYK